MPRFLVCAILLLGSLESIAQQRAQVESALDGGVAPDEFVILVTGACETKPGDFAIRDCVRGVTRAEFEQIISIAAPNATPQIRQKVAEALGEIIILSNEAKKRDLPKDPAIKETVKFSQLQALQNLLISQSIKKDADNVPQADVEAYYNAHIGDYQSGEFQKIIVPATVSDNVDERTKLAADLQKRCVAGEDPAKLQAEIDDKAKRTPTKLVELKNQHQNFYPVAEHPIFDLKPGQCSAVIPEQQDLAIYKVTAIKTTPIADVKDQIVKSLQTSRMKDEIAKIKSQNVVSLNGKYFTVPAAPQQPATPKK
ncbi:peptidyl-prolyl cis-trans isomerase [Candidatus Korobacter versatilis]|uniref:peptidylprolyl isomerase n=1 Tax=Candidatus Korobacter versatilis TaxID=658062 RepID=UPI0002DA7735|nr:peptidylprolyl isomerase [Candidatus Koribacter versatilis]